MRSCEVHGEILYRLPPGAYVFRCAEYLLFKFPICFTEPLNSKLGVVLCSSGFYAWVKAWV